MKHIGVDGRTFNSFEECVAAYFEKHRRAPETLGERLARFRSYFWTLYWKALDMHEVGKTKSYRGFGVGAAGLAFRSDRHIWDGQAGRVIGFNSKTHPDDAEKCCAERRMFDMAVALGYEQLVGIVVVGPHQKDDTTGHECTTLHPCILCRTMMRDHPLAWPQMPIITALPPPETLDRSKDYVRLPPGMRPEDLGSIKPIEWCPTYELHTLEEILEIHKTA